MTKIPVLIHPYFSDATIVSTQVASYLIDWLLEHNIQVIDVPGFMARPRYTLNALYKQRLLSEPPYAIFYIGHGLDNSWTGYEYHTLLDVLLKLPYLNLLDTSPRLINRIMVNNLKDTIIATVACKTLNALAPFLIRNGVKAYLGSTANMNVSLEDYNLDSVQDINDLYTIAFKTLALGHTVHEAVENTRLLAGKYLNCCGAGAECLELFSLVNRHYGYLGDGNARWMV